MEQLARLEMVLSRMAMQLAARLQPLVWPRAAKGKEGDGPAVGSFFDLMLLSHHIIGGGPEAFAAALADPAAAVRAVWPPGVGRWCVVSEVEAQLAEEDGRLGSATPTPSATPASDAAGRGPPPAGGRRRRRGPRGPAQRPSQRRRRRRCRGSGPSGSSACSRRRSCTPCCGGPPSRGTAPWRLCSQLCSPWEIGKPRTDAGVLELVALIARYARDDPGEGAAGGAGRGAEVADR